jgi:hypothetical protein
MVQASKRVASLRMMSVSSGCFSRSWEREEIRGGKKLVSLPFEIFLFAPTIFSKPLFDTKKLPWAHQGSQ